METQIAVAAALATTALLIHLIGFAALFHLAGQIRALKEANQKRGQQGAVLIASMGREPDSYLEESNKKAALHQEMKAVFAKNKVMAQIAN